MTRQEFKEALASKRIIFINRFVKTLGGSKRGNKAQDIEEILAFYDKNPQAVESAFNTMELVKKNRLSNLINAFSGIREHWEILVKFVESNENVPENIQDAIEYIDSIIDSIFGSK